MDVVETVVLVDDVELVDVIVRVVVVMVVLVDDVELTDVLVLVVVVTVVLVDDVELVDVIVRVVVVTVVLVEEVLIDVLVLVVVETVVVVEVVLVKVLRVVEVVETVVLVDEVEVAVEEVELVEVVLVVVDGTRHPEVTPLSATEPIHWLRISLKEILTPGYAGLSIERVTAPTRARSATFVAPRAVAGESALNGIPTSFLLTGPKIFSFPSETLSIAPSSYIRKVSSRPLVASSNGHRAHS